MAADRLGYFSSKASGGSENEVFGDRRFKGPRLWQGFRKRVSRMRVSEQVFWEAGLVNQGVVSLLGIPLRWVLMVLGVISAAVASYSKKPPQGESEDFVLGLDRSDHPWI